MTVVTIDKPIFEDFRLIQETKGAKEKLVEVTGYSRATIKNYLIPTAEGKIVKSRKLQEVLIPAAHIIADEIRSKNENDKKEKNMKDLGPSDLRRYADLIEASEEVKKEIKTTEGVLKAQKEKLESYQKQMKEILN